MPPTAAGTRLVKREMRREHENMELWHIVRRSSTVHLAALCLWGECHANVKPPGAAASATGTRTQVARVRAEYPNQLDYGGLMPPTAAGTRLAKRGAQRVCHGLSQWHGVVLACIVCAAATPPSAVGASPTQAHLVPRLPPPGLEPGSLG